MATPHVAGLVAYLLSLGRVSTSNACDYLIQTATNNVLTGLPAGTPNRLAYNGGGQ